MAATAGQSSRSICRSSTDGGAAVASVGRTPSSSTSLLSAVVVERELGGMWAKPHDVHLVLALVVDPGADQLLAEHAARSQELMIRFECVERFRKRARNLHDAVILLEQIPIRRLAGVEPFLDPVDPGHQHRRE